MKNDMVNNVPRHVYKRMQSPVGTLTLVATDRGLAAILWENDRPRRVRLNLEAEQASHPVLVEAERQLTEKRMRVARKFGEEVARIETFMRQAYAAPLHDIRPERKHVLDRMSPLRRTAFMLFEIEGYSGEEIAELEQIPLATVYTRLHHARRDLARAMSFRVASEVTDE